MAPSTPKVKRNKHKGSTFTSRPYGAVGGKGAMTFKMYEPLRRVGENNARVRSITASQNMQQIRAERDDIDRVLNQLANPVRNLYGQNVFIRIRDELRSQMRRNPGYPAEGTQARERLYLDALSELWQAEHNKRADHEAAKKAYVDSRFDVIKNSLKENAEKQRPRDAYGQHAQGVHLGRH